MAGKYLINNQFSRIVEASYGLGKDMKRILLTTIMAAVLLVTAWFIYDTFFGAPPGRVNTAKIMNAANAYAQGLKTQGKTVPATVNLKDLIAQGLLAPNDVSGFAGMDVTVSLVIDRSHQDVLLRARLPDGQEIVAMTDGSVQQRKP
jgi:hypothetical protein